MLLCPRWARLVAEPREGGSTARRPGIAGQDSGGRDGAESAIPPNTSQLSSPAIRRSSCLRLRVRSRRSRCTPVITWWRALVLMQIDPRKQQATVNSQEHSRAAQEANLQYAQQQYNRTSGLAARGSGEQAGSRPGKIGARHSPGATETLWTRKCRNSRCSSTITAWSRHGQEWWATFRCAWATA